MKRIVSLLIIQICISSCAFTNTENLIQKNVSSNTIFRSTRAEVEKLINANLDDYYNCYVDGIKYSGARYDNNLFIFKNNELVNIVSFQEAMRIWEEEFIIAKDIMPYSDNLDEIQRKISSLPLFDSREPKSESNGSVADNVMGGLAFVSDATAAAMILAISAPIIPFAMIETSKKPDSVKIDWDKERFQPLF